MHVFEHTHTHIREMFGRRESESERERDGSAVLGQVQVAVRNGMQQAMSAVLPPQRARRRN